MARSRVFNGEIYNFRELRDELARHGHRFVTQSDTEVIVHGYEQWGDDVLYMHGMFAIALWDERHERLLLARDRMGEKPLYWHHSARGLLWGSEAKALLAAPWVERRVNALALHHYLTLQYTPDPLEIFEDIRQLPPPTSWSSSAMARRTYRAGGSFEFAPKWELSEAELIEQARARLCAAVERRLISEVPLGAFLSGGNKFLDHCRADGRADDRARQDLFDRV